jgi:phosphoribosylamine---glycine ligase
VAREMVARGTPFSGLLYAGLVLTATGPAVIEFNCRFGDPETQAVLALLRSPLARLLHATATGALAGVPALDWSDGAAVVVVLAAEGYPATPRLGDVIGGAERDGVLHAGTRRREDGAVVSAGGRVLSIVGVGVDLAAARDNAYATVQAVHLPGGHYRTDIAANALALSR